MRLFLLSNSFFKRLCNGCQSYKPRASCFISDWDENSEVDVNFGNKTVQIDNENET